MYKIGLFLMRRMDRLFNLERKVECMSIDVFR